METFGQKLHQALRSRGLRPDEAALRTGLGIESIRALERDDHRALPDDEALSEGLRSLARLMDVDPDEVIADYRRERSRWLAAMPPEVPVLPAQDEGEPSVPIVRSSPRSRRPGRLVLAASLAVALPAVFLLYRSGSPRAPEPAQVAGFRSPSPVVAEPGPSPARGVALSDLTPPPSLPAEPETESGPTDDASRLSIAELGVGNGVVGRELTGEAQRFPEGERVWFWTRVDGGAAGDAIDHVWIHEGAEALRVPLRVGGARWRTQSHKDLNAGSAGNWVVEARDEDGRVLARREFLCLPSR